MALRVNEMGIQVKIAESDESSRAEVSSDPASCADGEARQREQDRIVAETVRRVLAILKARGER